MDQQALDLLMQLPMGIAVFKGEQYIIEMANDKALELWGKKRLEVIDKSATEVFPELVSQGFDKILAKVFYEGERFVANEQPLTFIRNGVEDTIYVNFSYDPFRNPEGKIEGFLGTGVDVTELVMARKKADEAYRALNFRSAVLEAQNEATPDGVLVVDTKGKMLLYNKRFGQIWNMPDSVLNDKDDNAALEFATTQIADPGNFLERVNSLYKDCKEKSYDEVLLKDGRVIERHGAPVIGEDGINYGWAWYFRDISDRKDHEKRLQLILESLPLMAWTAKPNGEVDYLNSRWFEYTGQTPELAKGYGWANVLYPDTVDGIFEKWQHSLESRLPYECELQYLKSDGTYRWHLTRAVPIMHDGNVLFWVGTCTDIHDFKELEELLKLQAIVLESMDEGVSVSDEKGCIVYTNKAEDYMFGYNTGELIGQHVTVQNMYDKEENERKVADVVRHLKQYGFWNGEWQNRRKDGSAFYTYSHITAIKTNNKTMFVCVQRNITEEKKSKEAIAYQNMLFKTMTDNATSTLFMMDKNGYCTFMNAGGEKMFGYTQEEIKEKQLHYIIHHHRPDGSFYPMHECPIDRALPENFDVRAHRDTFFKKDGSSFPVTCAASPIFEDGVPVSTVIEVRDITLELEAEQALRRSAIQLEQLVEERTRELKAANDQLQQFTYAASHDLQEPLRKINFFIDRLQTNIKPTLDQKNLQIIEKIQGTSNRMRKLISDLLDYSNAALGATVFSDVDLNLLIEEVLSDMEATVIEKSAIIEAQQLPIVKGDGKQLRQMFQNLISNALKYSKHGVSPSITISVKLGRDNKERALSSVIESDKKFYQIEVADNGIGFEQEHAEKIFQIFQRLHGRAEYEGTGIGLSIVSKVAENHNGYITAESQPGKGASFKVFLPA